MIDFNHDKSGRVLRLRVNLFFFIITYSNDYLLNKKQFAIS